MNAAIKNAVKYAQPAAMEPLVRADQQVCEAEQRVYYFHVPQIGASLQIICF